CSAAPRRRRAGRVLALRAPGGERGARADALRRAAGGRVPAPSEREALSRVRGRAVGAALSDHHRAALWAEPRGGGRGASGGGRRRRAERTRRRMIIDCHCHAGKGDGLTGPWDTDAPLDAYLRRAAQAGIDHTVIFAAFHSDYRAANREVAKIVRADP